MNVSEIVENHYERIKASDFKGYDVYDGLNSRILRNSPLFRWRPLRLAWIQFFKRCPINLRPLAMIPRGYNSKGLALFIRGLINLHKLNWNDEYLNDAYRLSEIIISQKPDDRDYFCVGYNFFWEARAFSVPEFTPNMVVSSFAGQAFMDLFDTDGDSRWLNYVEGIARFMEKELKLFQSGDEMAFGYIPGERVMVHNANLMGSSFFARLFSLTGENSYRDYAIKSARHSVNAQRGDGAWVYGERQHHRWVDNFHTGFNLIALNEVQKYLETERWKDSIDKGLDYHLSNHFLNDMTPKYYHRQLYPLDIHNYAQGIITHLTFSYPERADRLLQRCVESFWNRDKRYFYYQKTRWYTNRIDYIRWSQAWMFYALTFYQNYISGMDDV